NIKAEIDANDILLAATAAARDGKLTAEQEMTLANLKNTNARIENINAEIKATQRLISAYAGVYDEVKTAAENGSESAARLHMRISVPVGKAQVLQAELASATAQRTTQTNILRNAEEVLSRTTTKGNKALHDKIKAAEKATKAQKESNKT